MMVYRHVDGDFLAPPWVCCANGSERVWWWRDQTWINNSRLVLTPDERRHIWTVIRWLTGGLRRPGPWKCAELQLCQDLRLTDLLSRDLVRTSVSLSCSLGIWSICESSRVICLLWYPFVGTPSNVFHLFIVGKNNTQKLYIFLLLSFIVLLTT